jgi:hypothetical protein
MKIVVENVCAFDLIYACNVIKLFSTDQGVCIDRFDPDIILAKAL